MNEILEIAVQTFFFVLIFGGGAFLYQWLKAREEKKGIAQRITPDVPVEKLLAANARAKRRLGMKPAQRVIFGIGAFILGMLLTFGFLIETADSRIHWEDTWGYWAFSISALTWFEIWLFRK